MISVTGDTLQKPTSQIGFMTFMVKPMYDALSMLRPLTTQQQALDDLTSYWKQQLPQASSKMWS